MTFTCILCSNDVKDGEEGMLELGLCWDCIDQQSLGHPSVDTQALTAEFNGGLRPGCCIPWLAGCLRVLTQGLLTN